MTHKHVWAFAPSPDTFGMDCERCGAWVSVIVDRAPNGNERMRFRCLAGTDPLVSQQDLAELARWIYRLAGMKARDIAYMGPPRASRPGGRRRRSSPARAV